VRISFENKSTRRTLPGIWLHTQEMDRLSSQRRPFLTETRMLSNQTAARALRPGNFREALSAKSRIEVLQ